MAAEVLGGKAEEEIVGWRGQKWTNPFLEPAADKGIILQFGLAEVGNSHLSKSLKSMWQWWVAVVGGLELEKKSHKLRWIIGAGKHQFCKIVGMDLPLWHMS